MYTKACVNSKIKVLYGKIFYFEIYIKWNKNENKAVIS